jgi:hypothetical protein
LTWAANGAEQAHTQAEPRLPGDYCSGRSLPSLHVTGTLAAVSRSQVSLALVCATLVGCAAPQPEAAEAGPQQHPQQRMPRFTSVEQVGEAVTWFYRQPSEATFTDIALDLGALEPELAKTRGGFGSLCAVFLWRCVQYHGYTIPDAASGRSVERARLLLSDVPATDVGWVTSIRATGVMSPPLLDVCWVSYFATGDTTHLGRIVDSAVQPLPPKTISVVASTARWSFKANCRQHPSVLQFAKQQRLSSNDENRSAFLDECIMYGQKAVDEKGR